VELIGEDSWSFGKIVLGLKVKMLFGDGWKNGVLIEIYIY
jgi:hypothetical protein